MIHGYCRTNLDNYGRVEWPEAFAAVPRIGDRVQAVRDPRSLKVVSVTHRMIPDPNDHSSDGSDRKFIPGIEVELNKGY